MQIIAFLVLLLAIALFVLAKDNIDKTTKWIVISSLLALVVLAFIYESYTSNIEEKNRAIINSFKQGKTITCKDGKVDNKRFNYENGTGTFMAKKEFKELSGIIIPITTCDQ